MSRTVLCTPLRAEQAALRRAGHSMRLVHTGMGPRRAAVTAAALGADPVLVAGVGGGLAPHVRPGDVVVASEVRSGAGERVVRVASAPLLAGALRRLGLTIHIGPIGSVSRIVRLIPQAGLLAVDMESASLAVTGVPFAVVRAIVDTPDHPLWRVGTLRRGVIALRTLRACRPALEWWAAATGPREVLLAAPRHHQRATADLMLVVGSPNSSDAVCLVAAAQREGVPAYLVNDPSGIDLRWLAGATRLVICADASAVPHRVDQILHCLSGLGPIRATDVTEPVDGTVASPREVV